MGLGKTLTMIALAASDLDNPDSAWFTFQQLQNEKYKVRATLIIVPPPRKCNLNPLVSPLVRQDILVELCQFCDLK